MFIKSRTSFLSVGKQPSFFFFRKIQEVNFFLNPKHNDIQTQTISVPSHLGPKPFWSQSHRPQSFQLQLSPTSGHFGHQSPRFRRYFNPRFYCPSVLFILISQLSLFVMIVINFCNFFHSAAILFYNGTYEKYNKWSNRKHSKCSMHNMETDSLSRPITQSDQ